MVIGDWKLSRLALLVLEACDCDRACLNFVSVAAKTFVIFKQKTAGQRSVLWGLQVS